MKTLAKYHACNHFSGPVSYRDFRETGPWPLSGDKVRDDFVLKQT